MTADAAFNGRRPTIRARPALDRDTSTGASMERTLITVEPDQPGWLIRIGGFALERNLDKIVAIDRATRWVFVRVYPAKTAANARRLPHAIWTAPRR